MGEYQMADIHMHIVPGVDDGSRTLEMSKAMLELAGRQGVRAVAATPHSFAFLNQSEPDFVRRRFQALREETAGAVRLILGCEVRCASSGIRGTLERLRSGELPSMNGTRYVLTEFDPTVRPDAAAAMTELLLADGWKPILAHVERYPALFVPGGIDRLTGRGCLLQINAYSLAEETDRGISSRARRLLAEGRVSFLGSDAHRLEFRPPSVERGLRYVYEHCEKAYADAVAFQNAGKYLFDS